MPSCDAVTPTASPSPIIGVWMSPRAKSASDGRTTLMAASHADSSVSAFQASSRIGAGNNYCPSGSSCWKSVRGNRRRGMEAAKHSRRQVGIARTAAALWCSSRNLPLNRSAGGLLTGSLSLTVRNRYSLSKLQRAWARALPVCAERYGYLPFEAKGISCDLPTALVRPCWPQDDRFHTRTRGKPAATGASNPIQYPWGPRPPQTPAASFKRLHRKCPGSNFSAHPIRVRRATSD
jgi:hypothetical protein